MRKILLAFILFAFVFASNAQIVSSYYDDFEINSSLWTVSNPNPGSPWQWGTPSNGFLTGAHSGMNCFGAGLNAPYLNNSSTFLISPVFDFSGTTIRQLSFWTKYNCEVNYDGFRLDYTTDGGITWNVLGNVNDTNSLNWYNYPSLFSTMLPGWNGNSLAWKQCAHDVSFLNGNASVQFRFVFASDASVVSDGVLIDDFLFYDGTGSFLQPIVTFASPPCGSPQTATIQVSGFTGDTAGQSGTVSLYINFGDGTDTSFSTPYVNNFYSTGLNHTYMATGNYSLQYIATAGAKSDTVTKINQVFIDNNCGNIDGYVYFDSNNDCVYNLGDSALTNISVKIVFPNGQAYFTLSDSAGHYAFNVPNGQTYIIVLVNANMFGYNSICPSSGSFTVNSLPSSSNNFAVYCAPGFDLVAHLWSWNFRPGFTSHIYASGFNYSCMPVSGQMIMALDQKLKFISASIAPDSINGDTLIWNFANAVNGLIKNISIQVLTDTLANIGDTLCNDLWVLPSVGDVNVYNNYERYCREVTNSLDPNEKTVNPAGAITTNQNLTYTIFFQNTGTAEAHNIMF